MQAPQLLACAYAMAAKAHAGQVRKGRAMVPYINHPCDVAARVAEACPEASAALIAAAVLHDVVEDSPLTLAEIEAACGAEVAALVGDLTDDPAWAGLPLTERKAAQAEKLAGVSGGAQVIKIADQISNLSDLAAEIAIWPSARHLAYLAGARAVVAACHGACPVLEAQFESVAAHYEAQIRQVA
ncbi:MAG: HD domain-containing protein [Neomegalonema sp.]|nr:HD domain-containing protein [Neomegalonema sp.]